jgi:hypothetical protein
MKTGDYDQGVSFDDKEQRVREAAQERTADISKHGGKLLGIIAHPFDQGINRLAKTRAPRSTPPRAA